MIKHKDLDMNDKGYDSDADSANDTDTDDDL